MYLQETWWELCCNTPWKTPACTLPSHHHQRLSLQGYHLCSPNSSNVTGERESHTLPNEPPAAQTRSYGEHCCHEHGSPWEGAHGAGVSGAAGRHQPQQLPRPFRIYIAPSKAHWFCICWFTLRQALKSFATRAASIENSPQLQLYIQHLLSSLPDSSNPAIYLGKQQCTLYAERHWACWKSISWRCCTHCETPQVSWDLAYKIPKGKIIFL